MAKIKNWIRIGTILNGFLAVFSAFIAFGVIVLALWGAHYIRMPVPNDYMAFIPIILRALGGVFSVLAPFIAGMAGVVFALSLISCLLGKASLKKHQNLPYSRDDLKNTTGRILCNGIMALGYLLILFFLRFRSFLVLGIVVDQLVICTLQVMEIREIRRLLPSSQY
ncbi:hypothetical protein SAMN02745687_02178 [Lachnospiraceae bacterium NK3A20]|nr:hypothetical protein SAMN02745687_02178 [Lachnospiraceae bacterium NK3A20]